jgi:SAM-dependent methyltransferase
MSFPWHDRQWVETAELLAGRARPGDRVLAPDTFWLIVPKVHRFVPSNLTPAAHYDWIVLDTSLLEQVPRSFLEHVDRSMHALFANESSVVWAAPGLGEPVVGIEPHLDSARARIAALPAQPEIANQLVRDQALADAPTIARFAALSDTELRAAMDDFFGRTGYRYPTVRDEVYRAEMQAQVAGFLASCHGRVLDLCAGGLAFADVPAGIDVLRVELSVVGTAQARTADGSRDQVQHATMDAHHLALPDECFTAVLFSDAIEHVRDARAVFTEVARVLQPGGSMLVTFANRRSVHMVLTQKLGYPEFLTNHHHIREFSLDDIREMLATTGFAIEQTDGVFLYPYWGVPGVDALTRDVVDHDTDFIDVMRDLGHRVGAEHAYTGVVHARRVAA